MKTEESNLLYFYKNMIEFRVDGKIRGKARPRFNVYSKKVYTTQQDKVFESNIASSYLNAYETFYSKEKYLRLEADMYFAIPKSYTKKRKALCLSGKERPNKKPDSDNVLKGIADGLNNIAYEDDIQLIEMEGRKFYTSEENDYMIIRLIELES